MARSPWPSAPGLPNGQPDATSGAQGLFVLPSLVIPVDRRAMPEQADGLTPATPEDLAGAIAFALRCQGHKRVHNANEIMAEIVAKRLVEYRVIALHGEQIEDGAWSRCGGCT